MTIQHLCLVLQRSHTLQTDNHTSIETWIRNQRLWYAPTVPFAVQGTVFNLYAVPPLHGQYWVTIYTLEVRLTGL